MIRKFTSLALVIEVNIKLESEISQINSKITNYKYVGLNLFIHLLINELRLKTNSNNTLPEISKKYYQLGEIEINEKDLKVYI